MSVLQPQPSFSPTPFLSVAGTQLALPPSCRPDLAYSFQYTFSPAAGANASMVVQGSFVEIPLTAFFLLDTSAAVLNRSPIVAVLDENGQTIHNPVGPALQTAQTSVEYTVEVGFGSAYGPIGGRAVFAMPVLAMLPGWQFLMGGAPLDGSDLVLQASLLVTRVPTGPQLSTATATAPIVTPILV